MWGRKKQESDARPQAQVDCVPPPAAALPVLPEPAAPPRRPFTIIGPAMVVKGEIRSADDTYVEGTVEGSVESDGTVTVGPNGKVTANGFLWSNLAITVSLGVWTFNRPTVP